MMTLNHGLSGYVCGQVAMPLLRRRSPLRPAALGWAWFLGAMLPDGDILVRLLAGRGAYFSGAWYGHRGMSHSIVGTLLEALLVAALLAGPLRQRAPRRALAGCAWLVGCAWAGGLLHLFGDLFTPGWQMPIFWPLDVRFGAWRHIGWFTPYLLWLFVTAIALAQLARWGLARVEARGTGSAEGAAALGRWAPAAAWGIYALAAYRWVSFLAVSRYESWPQWVAAQQALLPAALVAPLTEGVHVLWHWFTG